jgi:hypothetical protein
MKEILNLIVIFCCVNFLQAQHLFSVSYNELSQNNVTQLILEISSLKSQISNLSLTKNNEDKDQFSIHFSSANGTKIILFNEQTGNHVIITPAEESLSEFQLAPFFIEELRQSILGDAEHYLIIETNHDQSQILHIASIGALGAMLLLPQYFYGKKEDVKEAIPQDRQILHIFKEKPQLILASPDDPELQRYAAQWEEEMSYYVYMYQLPDGTLCIFDEHFMGDNANSTDYEGYNLAFNLVGSMDEEQREATEYALELWGEQLGGRLAVEISVSFDSLANNILGSSYRMPSYMLPGTNTWYCSAVGKQLAGAIQHSMKDIRIIMNKNYTFYYGVDGKTPNGKHDYLTIMLHEITHGLGFFAQCGQNGAYSYTTSTGGGAGTPFPGAFDRQLCKGLDGALLPDLNQSERAALVISNNLYAGAPSSHLLEANEGVRVKIYAPTTYNSGSSTSHWDNSVTFPTFMKYSIGSGASNALHTFNDRKIGLMLDIGWTLPIPNPDAYIVTFMANDDERSFVTQQFLFGVTKKIKPNTFKRDGYSPLNWNTSPYGTGTVYDERATITPTSDMILYAQWEANEYTLQFNPLGGSVDYNSKKVTFDALIGELPFPKREGYIFKGWQIGYSPINEETIWKYPSNQQARAQWMFDTSIEEIQLLEYIQIVPNPTTGELRVEICDMRYQIFDIVIYDAYGKIQKIENQKSKIEKSKIEKSKIEINISHLANGTYFIKMTTEAGEVVKKIIKN